MAIQGNVHPIRQAEAPENQNTGDWFSFSFENSRWWGLATGNLARLFFPKKLFLTDEGIRTAMTRSVIFPWKKEDELMSFRRVSSIRRLKGLFWDSVIIETSGGKNRLDIDGLTKPRTEVLLAALNRKMAAPE